MKFNYMKTTKPSIDEASDRLGNVPETQRLLYTNVCALRSLVNELETEAIRRMASTGTTPGSSVPLPILNARVSVTAIWRDLGAELSSAQVLLATVEASREFEECAAVVEPLVAELT